MKWKGYDSPEDETMEPEENLQYASRHSMLHSTLLVDWFLGKVPTICWRNTIVCKGADLNQRQRRSESPPVIPNPVHRKPNQSDAKRRKSPNKQQPPMGRAKTRGIGYRSQRAGRMTFLRSTLSIGTLILIYLSHFCTGGTG